MDDKYFLTQAKALSAKSRQPLPCGCVLVDGSGQVVAEAYNSQRADRRTAAHAEMKAIAAANATLGRNLQGITAYGNLEPCTMCLSAMIFAGVERIVFTARLNDLLPKDKRVDIDCFEFVRKFPNPPTVEQITL